MRSVIVSDVGVMLRKTSDRLVVRWPRPGLELVEGGPQLSFPFDLPLRRPLRVVTSDGVKAPDPPPVALEPGVATQPHRGERPSRWSSRSSGSARSSCRAPAWRCRATSSRNAASVGSGSHSGRLAATWPFMRAASPRRRSIQSRAPGVEASGTGLPIVLERRAPFRGGGRATFASQDYLVGLCREDPGLLPGAARCSSSASAPPSSGS